MRPGVVTGCRVRRSLGRTGAAGSDDRLALGDVLRIPLEGLVLVAVALVLPAGLRRWAAAGFGAVAGVLVVLRIVNAGFDVVLDRPFDPLGDWGYFGSGIGVLGDSIGDLAARLAAVGVVLLIGAVVVGLAGSRCPGWHGSSATTGRAPPAGRWRWARSG